MKRFNIIDATMLAIFTFTLFCGIASAVFFHQERVRDQTETAYQQTAEQIYHQLKGLNTRLGRWETQHGVTAGNIARMYKSSFYHMELLQAQITQLLDVLHDPDPKY